MSLAKKKTGNQDRVFYTTPPQDAANLVTINDAAVGRERSSGHASAEFVTFQASSTIQQRVSKSAREVELVEVLLETLEDQERNVQVIILTDSCTALQTLTAPVGTRHR